MKINLNSSRLHLFLMVMVTLGLLSGCDSGSTNGESSIQSSMLVGLWENRSTANISDGVLSNTTILERNSSWYYVTDIGGEELLFQSFGSSEEDNCLQLTQSESIVIDNSGHYVKSSDMMLFGNLTVIPSNSVLTFTTATSLNMARERVDVSFMQLQICSS